MSSLCVYLPCLPTFPPLSMSLCLIWLSSRLEANQDIRPTIAARSHSSREKAAPDAASS